MSHLASKLSQTGLILNKLSTLNRLIIEPSSIQVRNYAARKGTRERKQKKKVKVEVQKVGFIPHNQRNKEKLLLNRRKLVFDDSDKPLPTDDVYFSIYFRSKNYPFIEAVQCHKETHHPDMYNSPNAELVLTVELNMQAEKKTRFVDDFRRIVAIPHPFDHGEQRAVIAFSKDAEDHEAAIKAGAQLAGGAELIKQFQAGTVSMQDYQYVVAHPNILQELVQLRGLLKRKFPNPKTGNLTGEVGEVVSRYMTGINYAAKKDEYEKNFGIIRTVLGNLSMESEQLEGNFAALIRDVYEMKPKREGEFIRRCLLTSQPSPEKLKVDYSVYLDKKEETAEEIQAVA